QHLPQILVVARALAGIAGREDARAPAQRIDLDTGIVRERRKTRALCREARLQERVRLERRASLVWRLNPQRALRRQIETHWRQELRQLTQLAAVATRKNDRGH